ncbi:tRNA pseudouridine(55) synthase TruB [Vaginisenegalia massiliensis]|uniref:tRNA pseudouridine(55) synthase TruB n=1 Tax=Vaginisenegalia massiliensis TaxID=2058294 RepID=UPI000F542F53|nr:tRNA pseudouridine(55) synthase TruB [Vaginisenegalia massiliensis]
MFNGILPVWKPAGMTSHDVVFKLRKILKMKKIGHTGTLDPEVEGVLLICLGQATKLVEFLMSGRKVYQGSIILGISTETEDSHGAIVDREFLKEPIETSRIDHCMKEMEGSIVQIPPYYSAVKVNGRRLYEYARLGQEVERPKRIAQIDSFERLNIPFFDIEEGTQTWSFRVLCGKGTYVRTLAVDLGQKLGYPSHMSHLVRMETGGFSQADCLTLEEIQVAMNEGRLAASIHPIERALADFPKLELTDSQAKQVLHGAVLSEKEFGTLIDQSTVLFWQDKALAIYYPHPLKPGLIKPQRMFTGEEEK